MRRLAILTILTACATAPPPASTPPPPIRPQNAAVAAGVICDASGRPVSRAAISAWAADPACNVVGRPETAVSGEDGSYQIRVGREVGPRFDACIVLEVRGGGAMTRVQHPVHYAPDSAGANRVSVGITLPPATLLTRAEADRLIDVVQRALRREQEAVRELALYLNLHESDTYAALAPFMQRVRGIESVALLEEGDRQYVYELRGVRGTMRVTIAQDSLTRIDLH
ncbi:MAG TPA: hypothetical protein VEK11_15330 [Thermoanaerobaculia bacterium]|nr:hypothetical protein [Thermoanaerobaculia bacterium]